MSGLEAPGPVAPSVYAFGGCEDWLMCVVCRYVGVCGAGDGIDESGARRRRRMGDGVPRLVQSGRLSLALHHRPVRQPTGR